MRVAALALVVTCSACTARTPKVEGKLSASGGELGRIELAPERCQSGGNWSFHGVAFFAGNGTGSVLELAEDPAKGWLVKVGVPSTHQMVVFDRSTCRTLEPQITVDRTRNTPQGFVSGTARFACATSDGLAAEGDLKFKNCN
jgi:hypothetical protein